jgi:hypothetical protein
MIFDYATNLAKTAIKATELFREAKENGHIMYLAAGVSLLTARKAKRDAQEVFTKIVERLGDSLVELLQQ